MVRMADLPAPRLKLSALGEVGSSTFLYGESRAVVNRLLYAMAHAVDDDPIWLDLGPGSLGHSPEVGPVELGWIPSARLFQAWDTDQARPQNAVGNMALLNLVRSDDPDATVTRLADFVRLAPIAQEVISRVPADEPCRALAIANSDRVRGDYPHTVDGIVPIVTALLDARLCPFVGAQGTPGPGRLAFGYVFEVRAKNVAHWREGSLIAEKVPDGSSVRRGVEIPLDEVPGLNVAFEPVGTSGQSP